MGACETYLICWQKQPAGPGVRTETARLQRHLVPGPGYSGSQSPAGMRGAGRTRGGGAAPATAKRPSPSPQAGPGGLGQAREPQPGMGIFGWHRGLESLGHPLLWPFPPLGACKACTQQPVRVCVCARVCTHTHAPGHCT